VQWFRGAFLDWRLGRGKGGEKRKSEAGEKKRDWITNRHGERHSKRAKNTALFA